jgi:two-component system, CitB family, sensor kinase
VKGHNVAVTPLGRVRGSPVAQQIFALQTLMVAAVVLAALALAYVEARRAQLDQARDTSIAVAQAVAAVPTVVEALGTPDPSTVIQPFAERIRVETGTDFVVVMRPDRTRLSHPDPARIGGLFIGEVGQALEGRVFTQEYTGTLGPSMRAVVPVYDDGEVIALVAVGITLERIQDALEDRLPPIAAAAAGLLALGLTGAWLVRRRLRRQTHGLGEDEITRMYEYYDAVLHAVREGLLLVDDAGRVQLVNDEARRLLGLADDVAGRALDDIRLPSTLADALRGGRIETDEIHLVGDRILVLSQARAVWEGRPVGSVVTLRDHTELRAISGELDNVRGMAETLRSQNHEAANRLHTVVSLIEMGRSGDALEFATEELHAAQLLTDQVVGAVEDPVVAALLLGKTAQAAERGIELHIGEETKVHDLWLEPRDLVTVLGNLIDNAFDAVAESRVKRVEVDIRVDRSGLRLDVLDSGPGLPPDVTDRVFQRGWSTKRGEEALGRGLGLALVGQVLRKYGGSVEAGPGPLGGAAFRVRVDRPGSAA